MTRLHRSPKVIRKDLKALGWLVEGSGAQVVFSSVPQVAGNNIERGKKTQLINLRLRDWHCQQNIGVFFDHGDVCNTLSLMATDGVHLSQRGERIITCELSGLIERALN